MNNNEKRNGARFDDEQKKLFIETIILSCLGPIGLVQLILKKTINLKQFFCLLLVWISFFWCRYYTGFLFPEVLYEVFIISFFVYGTMIFYLIKTEVDVLTIILVMSVFLIMNLIGYSELVVFRSEKHLIFIDMLISGSGILGYVIATYYAFENRK
ncbi:hypothetical protein ACO0KY_14900 [Undibacterium sp. Dicai25W]|uniref:hypothetical protein n=1 Tax=Undibacterium sp. Dicai25W TaxID=3413034 RepID=UPI003BF09E3E